jgi:4-amino-4-deoxy-L-arabinose transferase-like glycosyltransferase
MTVDSKSPRRELGLLALWLLATIALRPLLLPDEGRYAGVAFEMLHGDRLVPTLDGLPFFHKPPLLYWLDMAAYTLLGVNQFSARIGPALLGWGLGAVLFLHLRRWHGPTVARLSLVVLATSPLFFVGAQYVNHDVGVAACITAAVLAIVRAVDDPARTHRGWLVAGWALCGLGVLAKGLIGIVLPAFIVGPWLLAQGRWRQTLSLLHPLGPLALVVVAGPWMWAMQSRYPGFFDYFIVEQHFSRFSGRSFNNRQPFWFFAVVLPLLMLPWSAWLWPALRQRGAKAGLYFWWVLAIVGFFSLPASKLVGYVMPALAPSAALLGLALAASGTLWPRVVTRWAAGAAALCVLLIMLIAWKAPGSHRDIGLVLREQWHAGDRLVYVDEMFYDLRFYARIDAPAIVLSDWTDPEVPLRDNWRKELFDATRFVPDAGRSVLWNWPRLAETACHDGHTWYVAGAAQLPRLRELADLETVLAGRNALLLRGDRRACKAPPS